jgi:hypothetical protein
MNASVVFKPVLRAVVLQMGLYRVARAFFLRSGLHVQSQSTVHCRGEIGGASTTTLLVMVDKSERESTCTEHL